MSEQELYERIADPPIVSPHGHTVPARFAEDRPFAGPPITPSSPSRGFAYALAIGDVDGTALHRIDVLDEILVAPEAPTRAIDAIAAPDVAVVTLTVTEKGHHPGPDGTLDLEDPGIAADLAAHRDGGAPPRSTIGLLCAGLARRAESGTPLTVLSCDNLPDNGPTLAAAVRRYASAAALGIEKFLDGAARFPASTVDRITPATDRRAARRPGACDDVAARPPGPSPRSASPSG